MDKEYYTKLLDKYLDSNIFILKLNFGILTGIVAVVSLLKYSKTEVYLLIGNTSIYFVSIGVVIIYGILTNAFILFKRHEILKNDISKTLNKIKIVSLVQYLLQIVIIIVIIMLAVNLGRDYRERHNIGYSIAKIQNAIEKYKNQNGIYPNNLNELNKQISIDEYLDDVGVENLKYQSNENDYKLIALGPDRKLGTSDDFAVDHQKYLDQKNK